MVAHAALLLLAGGVRSSLLAWQKATHPHLVARGTRGLCTIASLAAVKIARGAGLCVEVAWGYFGQFPHTWLATNMPGLLLSVTAPPEEQLVFYDLTADQFIPDAPGVAVVPPASAARRFYRLVSFGPETEASVADPGESDDAEFAEEVAALFYAQNGKGPEALPYSFGSTADAVCSEGRGALWLGSSTVSKAPSARSATRARAAAGASRATGEGSGRRRRNR